MTFAGRVAEARSNLENPAVPISSAGLELFGAMQNASGVSVNEKTALRHIAVYRCVELIAGTCASLPLKAFRKPDRAEVTTWQVLDDPHPELTRFETWEIGYACLLLWGNAYFRKLRDGSGRVRYLWPIHPSRVEPRWVDPPGMFNPADPQGNKVFVVDGREGDPYTAYELLHIPGMGYDGLKGLSRIRLAAQAIGAGMAADEYAAKFFGSGSLFSGILKTAQVLDQNKADALKERWRAKVGTGLSGAHDIAVLDSGAEFQPVSIPPEDAQLLESRSWSTTEIARLFGMPPHAIGDVEKSTSWGTGIEQQTIGMVKFTLQPSYLTRVEQRMTKEIIAPADRNVYAEHVIDGLLKGDTAARYAAHAQARQWGLETLDQFNALENKPLVGGDLGDSYLIPAGYTLVKSDGSVLVDATGADPTAPAADPTAGRSADGLAEVVDLVRRTAAG